MIYTPEQAEVIAHIYGPHKILSVTGVVGSGKSVPVNRAAALFIVNHLRGENGALFGHSAVSMKENQVEGVEYGIEWHLKDLGFHPVVKGGNTPTLYVPTRYGVQILPILGHGDSKSLGRIQGKSLKMAVIDEATLMPKNVLAMLLTRFRKEGCKVWATMNPGDEDHHYKKMVIDNPDVNNKTLHFREWCNPIMTPELYKSVTGHLIPGTPMHDVYALGKWTSLSGVIYNKWFYGEEIDEKDAEWSLALDWSIGGIMAHGLYCKGKDYTLKRHDLKYDSRIEEPMTPADHALRIADWVRSKGQSPQGMKAIIDPSTSNLAKPELEKVGFRVINGENAVEEGILATIGALANRTYLIHPDCKDTVRDFRRYIWDPKQKNRPLKTEDISHFADETRYHVFTNIKHPPMKMHNVWEQDGMWTMA